jgi:uncharacterized protein (DUF1810 family)
MPNAFARWQRHCAGVRHASDNQKHKSIFRFRVEADLQVGQGSEGRPEGRPLHGRENAMPRLQRYLDAQESTYDGYAAALEEMRGGSKRGHWIWYVFPQLAGLGSSAASREFAIRDTDEAAAFLRDTDLRTRYRDITAAVAEQLGRGIPLALLMRSEIDARKVVSSLTLFEDVARQLHAHEGTDVYREIAALAGEVLATVAQQGYERCAFTQNHLRKQP